MASTAYSYGKSGSKDKKRILDQLRGLQRVLDDVRTLEHKEAKATPQLSELIKLSNDPLKKVFIVAVTCWKTSRQNWSPKVENHILHTC